MASAITIGKYSLYLTLNLDLGFCKKVGKSYPRNEFLKLGNTHVRARKYWKKLVSSHWNPCQPTDQLLKFSGNNVYFLQKNVYKYIDFDIQLCKATAVY